MASRTPAREVTLLLEKWRSGHAEALDELLPLVYQELRRIAGRRLAQERDGHSLQTTALVHEAYLRLVDQQRAEWAHRAQFYGVAAQLMRRVYENRAEAEQVDVDQAQVTSDLKAVSTGLELWSFAGDRKLPV